MSVHRDYFVNFFTAFALAFIIKHRVLRDISELLRKRRELAEDFRVLQGELQELPQVDRQSGDRANGVPD